MQVRTTTRIAWPPATVFDLLADLRNDTQWNSRVSSLSYGARSRSGTELESEFDSRPQGFLKVLFPLLAPVIPRDVPKQHASFKALCER